MSSSCLPSRRHIMSWGDENMPGRDILHDRFTEWKQYLDTTGRTGKSGEITLEVLKTTLEEELLVKGIEIHRWVPFNGFPASGEKPESIPVKKQDLRFFIDLQWALFKEDLDELKMLKDIRRRHGQYITVTCYMPPMRATQKRKHLVAQGKTHTRLSSKKSLTSSGRELLFAGVLKKAIHHNDIAKPPKRQSLKKAGQAVREKHQGTRGKSLRTTALIARRRRMGLFSQSDKSVGGQHQARKDGASRSKKQKLLKTNKCTKLSPRLMKGAPTFSSTPTASGDIVRESRETKYALLHNDCAVSGRQEENPFLPSSNLVTPTVLDGTLRGPAALESSLPVIPPICEVYNPIEVKQLVLMPSLPAENAVPKWYQDAEDSLPHEVEVDIAHTESQASQPTHTFPLVKPPLPVNPPIWAQSRQEVCESFDWFRSYQGGVYHSRNVARGYLLSAFAASRDIFTHGGRLIISHGGGKAQSTHMRLGQHIPQEATDQLAHDKSVRALLENYRTRQPIVLLIDDKYVQFPYDLGIRDITYAVLGFYTIVHAWAEYQPAENERGRVVRYKFAFQWCEAQGDPWWLKFDSPNSSEEPNLTRQFDDGLEYVEQSFAPFEHIEAISIQCLMCRMSSAQIYIDSWACLNPDCIKFWLDINGRLLKDDLQYNSGFTQLAPASALAIPAEKLEPRPPGLTSPGLTTDYAYTRGWHCRECGRLSCRYKWEHWECMHCKAVLPVAQRVHSATEFIFFAPPVSFKESFIANDSGIEPQVFQIFELSAHDGSFGQCFTYKLPEGRGFIHHIKTSNPFWNKEADEIFQEYQEQASTGALPFRRWPMRAHKCRGALLTNYFSQNAGVPYQYVGGTENTLPFDKVPSAVVKARNLIQTRVKQALGKDEAFNEVLSAAYMERQRMAFHTDDEIGLGPFVAGLSFGSPALMHFRLLARHCQEGAPRSIAITVILRHGDVLVMDGGGVQQFYEHTVVPTNFRIAATARYINTKHPKRGKS